MGVAAEGGMQECILSEAKQAGEKIQKKKEKTLTTETCTFPIMRSV